MSLRVWLPLNGTLENKGLSDINLNATPTYVTGGKIGNQCLASQLGWFEISDMAGKKQMSFAYWVKINTATSTNWLDTFSWYSTDGTTSHRSRQEFYTNSTQTGVWFQGGSIGTTFRNTVGDWNHYVFTIDYDKGEAKFYINGELTNTSLAVDTTHYIKGTGSAFLLRESALDSHINDFRLYDHILSPLEVKHIAQGLILHYPLNRGGWGNDNILVNTHFDSRYTQSTGWDTTKNGTQLASSWGGYNGGVSNSSTVYHAHLKEFNGEWVYEYIKTANEGWLGISQSGLNSKLIAGKTYTFSWEEYRVEGNNYPIGGLYYFKTGATSANFHLGYFGGSHGNVLGKWRKFSYTFVAPTDGDYSKSMVWYIYGQFGGNGKMYMRHPKLEEGSIATPWCPNSSDVLATTMGLNDNVEYDTSGYENNGTRVGTFSWTGDTPKYNVSQIFSRIHRIEAPFNPGNSPTFTVAGWFYHTGGTTYYGAKNSYNTFICLEGGRYFVYNSTGSAYVGYWTSTANTWQHVVLVHDAVATKLKLYINGNFVSEVVTNGTIYGSDILDIGGRQGVA